MARDYEDLFGTENMSDEELRDLVYQQFSEVPEIDPDLVEVEVQSGNIRLSGRVGTEQELQQIEHVVTDVLGLRSVNNELVIDELVRGERAEAADDAAAEEVSTDSQLGTGARRTEDSARHLMGDLQADSFGTHDPQQAVADGVPYEPPDRPVQEGTSRENH